MSEDREKKTDLVFRDFDFREAVDTAGLASRAVGDDRIPIAISSEAGVERYDWSKDERFIEVLDHAPASVDLSCARDGLPLLMDHDPRRQVGLIEDVRVGADRKLRGLVRFSRGRAGQDARKDMEDGIRQKISVGYRLDQYTDERAEGAIPTRRYTRWTPMEGSSVAIPADYAVGVGRSAPAPIIHMETRKMQEEKTTRTPEQTAAEIHALCDAYNIPRERERDLLSKGATVDEVRTFIMTEQRNALKAPINTGSLEFFTTDRERNRYSLLRVIKSQVPELARGVDAGFEREVSDTLIRQTGRQTAGFLVPNDALQLQTRALSASTATLGLEAVLTEYGGFIELLRNKSRILELGATVLNGLQGPVSFVKQLTSGVASWVAEGPATGVAASDLTLGTVSLPIKQQQSSTSFTRNMVIQSSVSVEQMVRNDIAASHALSLDLAALNGSGASNQPTGILQTAGIGSVAIGTNGGAPTYDHMVDLEAAIENANADGAQMGYLTTPGIKSKLKKTASLGNTANVPVWLGGQEGTVNGYRAFASLQVPSTLVKGTSSDCHAIVFGDFSQCVVGFFGNGFELIVDPYTLATRNMIQVTSYQAVNVAFRYAAAFAAIKDARNI